MKNKLERCCRCLSSKAILTEVHVHGKRSYLCQDCKNGYPMSTRRDPWTNKILPSFLKH